MANLVELLFNAKDETGGVMGQVQRNLAGLQQQAQGVSGAIGGTGSTIAFMATSIGAALFSVQALERGLQAVANQGKAVFDAMVRSSEVSQRLATAFALTGTPLKAMQADVDALTNSLAKTTRWDVTDFKDALQSMTLMIGSSTAAMKLLPVVADIAAARTENLGAVADGVSRAISTGFTRSLRLWGIELDATTEKLFQSMTPMERMMVLLPLLTAKFGGSAKDDLTSFGGQVGKLRSELSNLRETMGDQFSQAGTSFVGVITRIIQKFDEWLAKGERLERVLRALGIPQTIRAIDVALGAPQGAYTYGPGGTEAKPTDPFAAAKRLTQESLDRANAAMEASLAEGVIIQAKAKAGAEDAKKALEELRKKIDELLTGAGDQLEQFREKITSAFTVKVGETEFDREIASARAAISAYLADNQKAIEDWQSLLKSATPQQRALINDQIRGLQDLAQQGMDAENKLEGFFKQEWATKGRETLSGLTDKLTEVTAAIDELDRPAMLSELDRSFLDAQASADKLMQTILDTEEKLRKAAREHPFDADLQQQIKLTLESLDAEKDRLDGIADRVRARKELELQTLSALKQQQEVEHALSESLQGIFDNIMSGGDFLDGFRRTSREAGKILSTYLASAIDTIFGTNTQTGEGGVTGEGQAVPPSQGGAVQGGGKGAAYANAIVQGIGGIMAAYQSRQSEVMVAIQSAVTAIGIYATLYAAGAVSGPYGWIVAAAAFVAQEVAHILSPSVGESYKYGFPGVSGGKAYIKDTENLTRGEIEDIIGAIQGTYEQFMDGYIKILWKLPGDFLAKVTGLTMDQRFWDSLTPGYGLNRGGYLGTAASQHYMDHLKQWISEGLPRAIDAFIWDPIHEALRAAGLTEDTISQIRGEMDILTPDKAMQLLGDWADAVMGIQEQWANLLTPSGFGPQMWMIPGEGLGGLRMMNSSILGSMANNPELQLRLMDEAILKSAMLATTMVKGSDDEANAINQTVSLMKQRYDAERQMIAQIENDIQQTHQGFQASIRSLTLQGMVDAKGNPNYKGQVDYLKTYLASLYQELSTSTDPQRITQIGSEIRDTINQIVQIGVQSGKSAEFIAWGISKMQEAETLVTDKLTAIGESLDQASLDLAEKLQPYLDALGISTTSLEEFAAEVAAATNAMRVANGESPRSVYGGSTVNERPGPSRVTRGSRTDVNVTLENRSSSRITTVRTARTAPALRRGARP